jgi:two-component system cell cycle sensor histidine kinase PleC
LSRAPAGPESRGLIRASSRPLRRLPGAALAYSVYAAVMLAAACGLWAIAAHEYEARLERMEHESADVVSSVEMLIGTCIDHVEMLRHQAEALLGESSASYAARRLFAGLAPSDDFSGYALDSVPRGVDPRRVTNLTGPGELPPVESGAGREMLMALTLNPLLEATHSQIPDAAWVYYISANRFIALQPWVPSRAFHWSEDLLTYDFYKLGLPAQNPERRSFWTDVYLDAGGKGMMTTVGQPVYDKTGRFRGTIDLDLTLGTMSHLMTLGDFGLARGLLVTEQNRVIADSATKGVPLTGLTDLADLLPQSALLRAGASAPGDRHGVFRRRGNWLVFSAAVEGAPWRLVMIVSRGALLVEVMRSIWIGFVGLALLAVALIAVEQRRRAAAALAENVAALKGITMNLAAARDEAQQANNAKSMLLANVSHELRTPLNAIIGFSDLMRHRIYGPLGDPRYEGYAEDIQRSGKLLLDLINDLLDVTRLESGHYELVETECDLAAILQEAAGLVKMQAERAEVAVTLRLNGMPRVLADQRALRQIVLNLMSNAVKFTPAKGAVRLCCALGADGRPAIAVEDTGRGIAPAEIKDLFRPFARTAEAKQASTPGTGLGLAIVKSLVELHQGTIAMESRLGLGTTVTVKLPAARVIAARVQGAA